MRTHLITPPVTTAVLGATSTSRFRRGIAVLGGVVALLLAGKPATAQTDTKLVRLAKLEIHPEQLPRYRAALKEEIEASLRVEPGVLTLYAVADKAHPTRITILEIYASQADYQAHLKTPHFLKYKNGTTSMVKSLELTETEPLLPNVPVK
ncbi:antibiotic biosynthesis monooxygenase [Hymenobacter sp. BT186]|uniref:Antibiotic biosynthesis monooxygenase n=1 Tax=Hymenobacter telluris TaxID=2816474 RepID=A0A939JD65_9BACT|nr:putative quinol monooxygenase [Hymenobacter telluris]MBO0358032.1 antibiotic biosynthesis monooxygenase [Hymenobacter telluris]MBW3374059.1 antibiotic biosynthesis monooxygenase [Hymenobacter norwichensis]